MCGERVSDRNWTLGTAVAAETHPFPASCRRQAATGEDSETFKPQKFRPC